MKIKDKQFKEEKEEELPFSGTRIFNTFISTKKDLPLFSTSTFLEGKSVFFQFIKLNSTLY